MLWNCEISCQDGWWWQKKRERGTPTTAQQQVDLISWLDGSNLAETVVSCWLVWPPSCSDGQNEASERSSNSCRSGFITRGGENIFDNSWLLRDLVADRKMFLLPVLYLVFYYIQECLRPKEENDWTLEKRWIEVFAVECRDFLIIIIHLDCGLKTEKKLYSSE